ncbi:MAG TPA: DUF6516 family protein [Spirochaetota bacterium]|nr:DUF6516 family protein [Spirochaetota bacterium]HOS34139.1 DUF6516 family protein [Spirochaetota bacterium]HOS54937.1 DUF6516 family protein [Spirochaetota bacterium]HOS54942.1 DUF6516 family protein [Spirochaetota bacterium]HPK62766.1 DUF6516 family protein [Spirochaetota bacterium]
MYDIYKFRDISEIEFNDITSETIINDINEVRIILYEGSFIDIWFSLKLKGRYSYHWDRTNIDGSIYRHDNAPHSNWEHIKTFPNHFHNGNENIVEESYISKDMYKGLREFLYFVRNKLKK